MANGKVSSETLSLHFESGTANISKEQMPCSDKMPEVLEYSGQRDPDPNQIECFLTNPEGTRRITRMKSSNKSLCQLCKQIFEGSMSKQELLVHINSVHSFDIREKDSEEREKKNLDTREKGAASNSFKCYICSKKFEKMSDFKSHLISKHGSEINAKEFDDLSYRCKKCSSTFPNFILLREHFMKKHVSLVLYRCVDCHAILRNKKSLKIHYNNFHACKNKVFHNCKECGKEFTNLKAMKAHFRLKHGPNEQRQGFRCRLCEEQFDSIEIRKLHYGEKHPGQSLYRCNECGKGFSSKSGLYGHRQLHKGEQVSTCPHCDKVFSRKDSYYEHILIHVGPKHSCPHCEKEFVQRSNLVRHIRIHTGQKPYACTFCEKRFSDKGACNSHIRVHTKEEQCACPYCGQTFTKKQKLKYHVRKHTGEGLLSCEICLKTFTNTFALKEHRAIHDRQTQTICVECGKAFNNVKYLQRHIALVHQDTQDSSAAPMHCPICKKTFCHRGRLKLHILTHLGKKQLQCLICGKRYSSMKSVRRHLHRGHDVWKHQPEFQKSYSSAFENAQLNSSSIVESIVSSSADEKLSMNAVNSFIDLDKTVRLLDEISKTSHEGSTNTSDMETNSDDRESSNEGEKPTDTSVKDEPREQLRSNLTTTIIDYDIDVKEELYSYQSQQNYPSLLSSEYSEDIHCLRIIDKETKLSSEYSNSEISRRKKQLGTPKKYVPSSESFEKVETDLKKDMPKRERVEAIARSLKESTNLRIISVAEEEDEEVDVEAVEEEEEEKGDVVEGIGEEEEEEEKEEDDDEVKETKPK